ncbi:MAG: tail sheath protein [Blastomonas sp. CACIA14H2]|uniref:phage tail sheath subtilisin-like domain-containing protein n=1 Tax=Blastomonas sp. CACIA14H2 TaxID=1419876 RepID=UPI0003D032ED|nr:MAG: tail sheath protein [Blastomonas sp. CACIA14H2]
MHGIKVNELTTGARPIVPIASAVIGLVATATAAAGAPAAALDAAFPLNTPVLVTDIRSAIGDAGTGGTLLPALEAIADQTSPILVVVRVAPGEDDAETTANVIGGNTGGVATGMQCLLDAQAQLGIRPRILGCPGLDVQEVTAEMVIVAKRLRGMVYARAIGDEIADVLTYREEFSARELMLVWPNFTNQFAGDAVARALGLRARIDEEQGWHKTLSNVAVDGVSGIDKSVYFDLQDATTPAGVLNDGQVTTIIRMNGYRFWGNRTCSDLPEFAFESAVRTAQVLQDTIAEGLAWAVDKPMTRGLIKDIIETINAEFRSLKAQGRIIDGKAWFDPALNSQTDLASGKLTIDYDFTPAAPAENIILNQRITDRYYAGFADQLN